MEKGGTNFSSKHNMRTVDHLKPSVNFAKCDLQISIYKDLKDFSKPYFKLQISIYKDLKDFSKPYFKLVEHTNTIVKFQIKPI
jgi:hypothetical protein